MTNNDINKLKNNPSDTSALISQGKVYLIIGRYKEVQEDLTEDDDDKKEKKEKENAGDNKEEEEENDGDYEKKKEKSDGDHEKEKENDSDI
ncbi:hypothetical protein F8M41_004500 [Gigaspora margarita]|uniref:Uncharacterized protein n=1 Tax=Gigaspora margarita TaxID=4874 RepID=A0A8H4AXJ6_GIGMA|nr:hypothetical protein F8M41_004500 [Gigaspora margarita]